MNLLLAKKKIIIIISAIITLISLVTGATTLLVSSQKQLNRLEQFPTHLDSVITNSLKGKDTPYYKVFLMSLDPGFLIDSSGNQKAEFGKLLGYIAQYATSDPKLMPIWNQDEEDAINIGQGIWIDILDNLKKDHLTYGAKSGLNYFVQNLAHGMTINKFFNSPTKQNQVLDDVLKGILTEMNLPLSYKQVNEVNQIATAFNYPCPPTTIVLATPDITGMKVGIVFLIIVTPILLYLLIFISLSYYLYGHKTIINNNWNKAITRLKKIKVKTVKQN